MKKSETRKPIKKIAYIEMDFPYVTTFMAAEMQNIKKKGIPIVILPIKRHSFENVQDVYHNLKEDMHYPPFFGVKTLWASLYFLVKSPVCLLSTIYEVLLSVCKPLKYVLQTWAILFKSVYCAWYVHKTGIDHVHGNWAHYPTTIAYIINKLTGVSFSFSSHAGADIYRNPDMLDRKIKSSTFVFTCVRENKIFMEKLMQTNLDEKVFVIYHGVDMKRFKMRTMEPITGFDSTIMLLSVGNLHEAKGFQYMIEACKYLQDRRIPFKYYIVGKGYFKSSLLYQIRKLKLQKEVELKGQILHEELLGIYEKANTLIMPSIVLPNGGRDGIPNVVIEAMCIGIPVVASNAAGIPEAIIHKQTGILVPPADPTELANGVETILNDPGLRARIVENARRFAEKYFDREKNFERIYEIVKDRVLQ